jgi:mono/diheme cytochrome c family protein
MPHLPTLGSLCLTLTLMSLPLSAVGEAPSYDGVSLYMNNCANCHGVHGEGDGIVAPALPLVLKDLRYLSARNDGEFPREYVTEIIDGRAFRAAHGPEGMPVWGSVFARAEGFDEAADARVKAKVDAVVEFLEALQID